MKFAICGHPAFALRIQEQLKGSDIEFKFFIKELVSDRWSGDFITKLPMIKFLEFRYLIELGELDGVIIVEEMQRPFANNAIQQFKFYNIPKVGIANLLYPNPFKPVQMLDPKKSFIGYMETNIVDGCNLNCKGCTHFAGLFGRDEIYPLENFRRDIRQLSELCDVYTLRLLGGEPLLLKNVEDYIKITRKYLPDTHLQLVTNGLLIPSMPQSFFDTLRQNNFFVTVSMYPPTMKLADRIKKLFDSNGVKFGFISNFCDKFGVFLTLHSGNNPYKSRVACFNNDCKLLRDGKIYKCPIDALVYRFAEYFGIENYPKSTGVDLYAQNFSAMLQMLNGNVEMCEWCGEKTRFIQWKSTNNPRIEDWLAEPDELKNFL